MTDSHTDSGLRHDGRAGPLLRLVGGIIVLIGAILGAGGAWLLALGGSPYNLILGLALVISGVVICLGSPRGPLAYLLVTVLACAWAIVEVGLNGWPLLPRTGLWLTLLLLVGLMWPRPVDGRCSRLGVLAVVLSLVGIAGLSSLLMSHSVTQMPYEAKTSTAAASSSANGDWTSYGNTLAATRFSPLTQLTPANVSQLKVAWTFHTGTAAASEGVQNFEGTPLKVDRTLYLCTPRDVVFALDAATGQQKWRFDPEIDKRAGALAVCRGVSYYKAPNATGACATRILLGTLDFRLLAVDAETGQRCTDFGSNGEVSLGEGFGPYVPNFAEVTSPPPIVNGVAVIGQMVLDNQRTNSPSGVIRSFDAVTGKLRWAWDAGRPDNAPPPAAGDLYTRDTPNAWTVFAADDALGLVYIPTGGAPPDYFGGSRRPEDDKYGSSVVALDAATGKVRWSFQTVHHDIWDYDIGSQPSLVDFPTADGPVPALIQPTKRGELFVLDRRDGHPLTQVEERPVPQGAVEGDHTSPTQPYSLGMPNFAGPDLTAKDMWGVTPIDQLMCLIQFQGSNYVGQFTPPSVKPWIASPGYVGGMDWGGVAVDTSRNILVVNSQRVANRDQLIPRATVDRMGVTTLGDPGIEKPYYGPSPQKGTPYGVVARPWISPVGMPCQQPPWGFLTAVDLTTQKIIWTQTFGTAYDNGPFGTRLHIAAPAGVPNQGGSVVTAGGLTFIGATMDAFIRAFDTQTGAELWRSRLPAGGQANPLSYDVDGRQYVVITAGGHMLMGTPPGDAIVAYALPGTHAP